MSSYKWNNLTENDILLILNNIYEEFGYLTYDHYKKLSSERGLPSMKTILIKCNAKWSEILELIGITNKKIKNEEYIFPDINDIYNKSGIYKILNTYNNKIYIGSSVNLYNRLHTHANNLKRNIHKNNHLQCSWNKYGASYFIFDVIEYVQDTNKLIEREQFWMDYFKSYDDNFGYNIDKFSKNCLGIIRSEETKIKISNSMKGIKKSEETKQKMRRPKNKTLCKTIDEINKSKKIKYKKPKYKKTKEEIHKQRSESQRGSNNPRAKLNENDIINIKLLIINGIKIKDIAKQYQMSENSIYNIKNGVRWKHVNFDDFNNYQNIS